MCNLSQVFITPLKILVAHQENFTTGIMFLSPNISCPSHTPIRQNENTKKFDNFQITLQVIWHKNIVAPWNFSLPRAIENIKLLTHRDRVSHMCICLMPNHYLNQCRLIDHWTPGNKCHGNLNKNMTVFQQQKAFKKWWPFSLSRSVLRHVL